MASLRPMRATLAVPAHRARLVAKAAASAADAVFMDLEDAVPPSEKSLALNEAVQALASLDWGSKRVTVRINAVDSPFIAGEIRALAALPRLDAVIVPKAERMSDIVGIAGQMRAAAPDRPAPVALDLLIETALGLVNVEALAACHDSIAALHLGVGDFAASIGARSSDIGVSPDGYRHVGSAQTGYASAPLDLFAYPMMRLLVAARAFGLQAIDGPCGAFRDASSLRAARRRPRRWGLTASRSSIPTRSNRRCVHSCRRTKSSRRRGGSSMRWSKPRRKAVAR